MDEELEQTYQNIEKYFLPKGLLSADKKNPKLVFLFSSPGAGKTTSIKPMLSKKYQNECLIHLEIDELKSFIPQNKENDTKFIDACFLRLLNKIIENKLSVIIYRQRNLLQISQTKNILYNAKLNGYTTFVDFLALDKERSRLSMASRYEHNINIKKTENDSENNNWRQFYPRKPNFLKHYIFYKAIPIMARLCTKLKTVDIINVYNRDTTLLLNYRKNKPAKEESVDVILRERNKPLNANEMKMYRDEKKALLENMKKRKVSKYSLFLYNLLFHRNK